MATRLDQSTDAKLAEIADVIQSGQTELTGRTKRDPYTGAIVGRFGGGIKVMYPEFRHFTESPSQIAAAIRRGEGKTFERVREAVKTSVAETVPESKPRKRGPLTETPHPKLTAKCRTCGEYHAKGEHRSHGEGAFHRTHLFSFGPNPMTHSEAKRTFAELMAKARTQKLTEAEKRQLTIARQVLRRQKRPAMWNKPAVSRTKARTILHEGRASGRRLTARQRRFFGARASGYPVRSNPAGDRVGDVVEIRYRRTIGKHRGFYKHVFKKRPGLYLMPGGTVQVR